MLGTSHQMSLWPLAYPWESVSSLRAKTRATLGASQAWAFPESHGLTPAGPIPTRTTPGPEGQLAQLSSLWSVQGPVNNHVTGKGPG